MSFIGSLPKGGSIRAIIRNPQHSMGNYLSPYSRFWLAKVDVRLERYCGLHSTQSSCETFAGAAFLFRVDTKRCKER